MDANDLFLNICFTTNILSMVVEELSYAIWLSFSVLRVYALSGRDWRAALSVTVPGLVVLGANIYLYAKTISENFPYPIGCLWTPVMSPDLYNARSCVIVTDVLVLVITWWRTYGTRKAAAEANIKVSLSTLILRDGTTYFLVLLAMNTLHIALTVSVRFTWIIALEEPLTTVLVSRFLLNLRAVDSNHSTDNITNPSFVQHPDGGVTGNPTRYAMSFIAPLGAPLRHGGSVLEENDLFELEDESCGPGLLHLDTQGTTSDVETGAVCGLHQTPSIQEVPL
ncbi:hypothetical protein C2E23DRAFT_890400 [Lenzites betulinus]|nr:hypothetical protein C2E23DRAFT_890400 [Lenzites betulinus]